MNYYICPNIRTPMKNNLVGSSNPLFNYFRRIMEQEKKKVLCLLCCGIKSKDSVSGNLSPLTRQISISCMGESHIGSHILLSFLHVSQKKFNFVGMQLDFIPLTHSKFTQWLAVLLRR